MDSYKWQRAARIVAVLDIIWGVIAIFLLALGAYIIDKNYAGPPSIVVILAWVISVISIFLNIFQIYATYKLFKSTDQGMGVIEAKDMTRFWMIVTVVSVILAFLGSLVYANWTMAATDHIIRGVFIAIIRFWMRELSSAIL